MKCALRERGMAPLGANRRCFRMRCPRTILGPDVGAAGNAPARDRAAAVRAARVVKVAKAAKAARAAVARPVRVAARPADLHAADAVRSAAAAVVAAVVAEAVVAAEAVAEAAAVVVAAVAAPAAGPGATGEIAVAAEPLRRRGHNPSSFQRKRLACAKAFMKRPDRVGRCATWLAILSPTPKTRSFHRISPASTGCAAARPSRAKRSPARAMERAWCNWSP